MKKYILFIVFLSVICMADNMLYGQASTQHGDTITIITSKDISSRHFTQRPKVGLVLSGGGAKGFSHLGVLRAINNAGVQVDYVGGTSIGAIVGGLYASGYTVEEMDSLLRDFDMMAMVGDKVERRHRSYYDKENEGKVWIKMGMKKFKLQFPTAISSGQNAINMMADWTISSHDIDDFSRLPIPYFSKVTDLSTGESVKLDKGYLPEAMRASATYPSLYSPIEIDGRTFIDGGVMDNYPIDEMRAMGADIVIGVNLNSPLYTAHEIESLVDILDQIVSFEIIRNVDRQMGNIDLDIHPDLRGYGAMSFTSADTIYARGEQAGALAMKHLEEIAAIQRRYEPSPRRITRPYVPSHFMVDTMIIHGNKLYDDNYFLGRVKGDFPMHMNLSDVKDVIDRIYSTGNFTNVYYRMRHSERDSTIYELHLTVKENPMDQYVGIGWVYDRLYGANILFNLRLNDVAKHTIIETDLVLGQNTSFKASIFHDNGRRLSFGADVKIGFLNVETSYLLTADPTIPDDYDMMMDCNVKNHYVNSQFYAQKIIGQAFTTRLGVEYLYMKSFVDNIRVNGQPDIMYENTYFISPFLRMAGDTRDDKFFPTKGSLGELVYKAAISPQYSRVPTFLTLELDHHIALTRHLSLGINAYAGLALGEELPYAYKFFPGGVRKQMPFGLKEFYGLPFYWNSQVNDINIGENNFLKLAGMLQYSPFKNQYIYACYNYGWISNDSNGFKATYSGIQGVGAGYGIRTPIGPFSFTVTYSPDRHDGALWGAFFSVGFSF